MNPDSEKADIWYALSDLYLDNGLGDSDLQYIATILTVSDYSLEKLEQILFDEVHPVLCWNLRQVAGHWGDFGRDWTIEAIIHHLNAPQPISWLQRFRERSRRKEMGSLKSLILPDWCKVKDMVIACREGNQYNTNPHD